ncbi:hypothetical protein BV898_16629 [Hypsibius exemplaris]|uniref:Uncharacterized protein n=1 Tax=Hypsibius exemplaris TaxID=2072580 RepID=A0A9X6NDK2_HYPEX|nr:hypothetical protein BV898_16629 [Hypsibius exemplaris]
MVLRAIQGTGRDIAVKNLQLRYQPRRKDHLAGDRIGPVMIHSITPSLHHSITPSLHHSITPSLHHSITPSLHHSITSSLHHDALLIPTGTTDPLTGQFEIASESQIHFAGPKAQLDKVQARQYGSTRSSI